MGYPKQCHTVKTLPVLRDYSGCQQVFSPGCRVVFDPLHLGLAPSDPKVPSGWSFCTQHYLELSRI